jgi:soluble lytic murein transglycosylase
MVSRVVNIGRLWKTLVKALVTISSRILLLGLMLWLLSACANSGPADDKTIPATTQALKPAPTRTTQSLQATATANIARPPTGTPTPLPAAPIEVAPSNQVPTATPTPQATVHAIPAGGQARPVIIEPPSPAAGVLCETEIEAYEEQLVTDPSLAAYQAPLIAACYLESGDGAAAQIVYETALQTDLDRFTEVAVRQGLGDLLVGEGDYPAAVIQYDAILAIAQTEISRSRALYEAGQAELLAGDPEAGYGRLLTLVSNYPESSMSYQAMTDLLTAGYALADYQQGLIAYNAQAYDVSAAAFARAVEAGVPSTSEPHLYLAWSLEKLGDVDGALAQLDVLIAAHEAPTGGSLANPGEAAQGRIERARLLGRAGRAQAALDDYQLYLTLYPQGSDAPLAAWRSASLAESLGYLTVAGDRYLTFSQSYPDHIDAARALFRAGYLSWNLGETTRAIEIWQRAVDTYPEKEYGAASLLWLLKSLPSSARAPYVEAALSGNGFGYYGPRSEHLANGVQPFVTLGTPNLDSGDSGRDFAESWLRQWLGLAPGRPLSGLSADLAADPRLVWAEQLWSSGSLAEAARQFEILRSDYATDPLASYQLAVYFRDLGLYKASILAALSVMSLAGVGAVDAPRFIARLAYPAYYADLVSAEASRYGYDPLLQLALIREESYFDALATSPLGARGLSQILPETGSHIAGQLGWPGYDAGALHRPEVSVAFGGYFLDQQLDRYEGNIAAALASYNAGPGFADGWAQLEPDDFDRLLEAIDFPETQRYIKQIYITHAIYRFLYT